MPRTKAQPAPQPSQSLDGLTVTFAQSSTANVPQNHDKLESMTFTQLKTAISNSQGSYAARVNQSTHLIATSEQYNKNISKVKEAVNAGINIVTYDWLVASLNSQSKVDETTYLLHPNKGGSANGVDEDEEEEDDKRVTSKKSKSRQSKQTATTNGKKRARQDDDDDDDDADALPAPKLSKASPIDTKEAKVPTNASMSVPVDEACPDRSSYRVYADDEIIFDVTLNQTNAGNNNNKFYRIQLLIDNQNKYWCWTRWGRVGDKGQTNMLGNGNMDLARREFEKKFKDKNGNSWANRDLPTKAGKYTLVERNYEESDDEADEPTINGNKGSSTDVGIKEEPEVVESKLPEPVQRLMKMIFSQDYFNSTMAAYDYDAKKMPLGKLSKKTLLKGFEVLKDLSAIIGDPSLANGQPLNQAIEQLSNQYFSLIPHAFGRNRPPVIHSADMVKKEVDLLENLTDMQLANEIMKTAKADKNKQQEAMNELDRRYQGLGMQEMTPLEPKSKEFKELEQYLVKSSGATHSINYKVQDIFRIERTGEDDRFSKSSYSTLKEKSDRRLLWHGSRCTNFGGILSQGLRIAPPEAPVTGYMFGKGVYLADMSTKSANYCYSGNSGGVGLLLLCDAELGKPSLRLTGADYNANQRAKDNKCVSTLGVGRTAPSLWKDAGCVHESLKGIQMPDVSVTPGPSDDLTSALFYNEYIVYDVAQIRLRYLLRVSM